MDEHTRVNRLNWDNRAELHSTDTTGSYRIAQVLDGGSCLHALEMQEIGDVTGKDIVHLQCHIGLDTLSLKHLGARSVAGLDFSPKAIEAAQAFAKRAGTQARFVEASVYDAPAALDASYDMAFVTWGAICWLRDIGAWARVVATLLRPRGSLYLLDGHPTMLQFEAREGRLELTYDWRTPAGQPLMFDEAQTYTGDARPLTHQRNYEWIHPIGDVINALIAVGMTIDFVNEHDILAWQAFPFMDGAGIDQFALEPGVPKIPLSFSIGATKRG